jgi:hypothetical protein
LSGGWKAFRDDGGSPCPNQVAANSFRESASVPFDVLFSPSDDAFL